MSIVLLPTVTAPSSTSGVTVLLSLLQLVLMRAKPQKSTKLKNTFFMMISFILSNFCLYR